MQNRPVLLLFTVLNSQIQFLIIANRMGFNFWFQLFLKLFLV